MSISWAPSSSSQYYETQYTFHQPSLCPPTSYWPPYSTEYLPFHSRPQTYPSIAAYNQLPDPYLQRPQPQPILQRRAMVSGHQPLEDQSHGGCREIVQSQNPGLVPRSREAYSGLAEYDDDPLIISSDRIDKTALGSDKTSWEVIQDIEAKDSLLNQVNERSRVLKKKFETQVSDLGKSSRTREMASDKLKVVGDDRNKDSFHEIPEQQPDPSRPGPSSRPHGPVQEHYLKFPQEGQQIASEGSGERARLVAKLEKLRVAESKDRENRKAKALAETRTSTDDNIKGKSVSWGHASYQNPELAAGNTERGSNESLEARGTPQLAENIFAHNGIPENLYSANVRESIMKRAVTYAPTAFDFPGPRFYCGDSVRIKKSEQSNPEQATVQEPVNAQERLGCQEELVSGERSRGPQEDSSSSEAVKQHLYRVQSAEPPVPTLQRQHAVSSSSSHERVQAAQQQHQQASHPHERTVQYFWDPAHLVAKVDHMSYDENGRLVTYGFDKHGRPITVQAALPDHEGQRHPGYIESGHPDTENFSTDKIKPVEEVYAGNPYVFSNALGQRISRGVDGRPILHCIDGHGQKRKFLGYDQIAHGPLESTKCPTFAYLDMYDATHMLELNEAGNVAWEGREVCKGLDIFRPIPRGRRNFATRRSHDQQVQRRNKDMKTESSSMPSLGQAKQEPFPVIEKTSIRPSRGASPSGNTHPKFKHKNHACASKENERTKREQLFFEIEMLLDVFDKNDEYLNSLQAWMDKKKAQLDKKKCLWGSFRKFKESA